ncbi:SDR family NAD(P)-dependent oxidoreductase [Chloroflexota bacterium]
MGRLDNKVAIITGGSTGIGKAVAYLFANEGAKVVVASRNTKRGEKAVEEIKEREGEAIFVKTDVRRPGDVKNMVRSAVNIYGKLDILVNSAGIVGESNLTADCTDKNWQRVIATNLLGVFLCMKYGIPEILKSGGGSIINMSSVGADRGIANLPAYCASKGGVSALTRTTAVEYADKNIKVNAVNPGTTATPLLLSVSDEVVAQHISGIPQKRMADPMEIAYAVLFLASDECRYTTGHSLVVDGGREIDSRATG